MIIYAVNCTIAIQIYPEMNARIDQKIERDEQIELEGRP